MKEVMFWSWVLCISLGACTNKSDTADAGTFEKQLQQTIHSAVDGDIIELPEGTYHLTRPLVIGKGRNITLAGKGADRTVLDFRGQTAGDAALLISADGVALQDFTLLHARGSGVAVADARNIKIRRVSVGATRKAADKASRSGFSIERCTNVLVEESEAFDTPAAGIRVAQSASVVIRKCYAHGNVAGYEIQNSTDVDIYENLAEQNSAGVAVWSIPDESARGSSRCRIFNNRLLRNNKENPGGSETPEANLPAGTGFLLVAAKHCEVFQNEITGYRTIGGAVLSYYTYHPAFGGAANHPYCADINIHDNKMIREDGKPDRSIPLGQFLDDFFKSNIPDLIYDGYTNPASINARGKVKEEDRLCITNNGAASFSNMDLPEGGKNRSNDLKDYNCTLTRQHGVKLNL